MKSFFKSHSATVLVVVLLTVINCMQAVSAKPRPTHNTHILNKPSHIELIYPNQGATSIEHAIIWLHGLGATANDFPPIVPHLGLDPSRAIRFIFPQAPERPITINGGFVMPGWYDIRGMDIASKEDRDGIEESRQTVERLIQDQIDLGIPAQQIILAGFSQGGAVTYYTAARSQHKLAGVLTLSTYLVFLDQTAQEQSKVNIETPIFASHGSQDRVVPVSLGEQSAQHLQTLGYTVQWQTYPMEHEVTLPQIQAIGAWINQTFSAQ